MVQGLLALALASPLSSWEQWELSAESQPDFEHSRGVSESPSPTGCDFNSRQAVCAFTEDVGPEKGAYDLEPPIPLIPDLWLVVNDFGQGTLSLRQLSILICKTGATIAKFQG